MKKYIIELIGTFFLVLVIGLTGNPLAIGSILMVMIYMGGHISGAHYNPAVTLAILVLKKITGREAMMYMVFQLIGALIAALAVDSLLGHTFAPTPANGEVLKALVVEIIFTFALASVVLNVAASKATAGNSYYGLAIGFTVLAGALAGGAISGGVFNPAVGIGACLIDTIVGGHSSAGNIWIYIVGPCAGALLGAATFNFTNDEV
jgi:aquaporin Z